VSSLKPRRLILVRHGETDWNAVGRIQGMLDVPLNALGLAQAKFVAEELARTIDVAAVISSDLVRARETTRPLVEDTGFPVSFDARIRERHFGVLQGRTYAEWHAVDAEGVARYNAGDPDYGPEGGETARAFLERCVSAVADMVIACDEKTLILVTHGGVVSSLYRHSQGLGFLSARTWSVPNASISEWRIKYHDDAPIFYCDRIGDDEFLPDDLQQGTTIKPNTDQQHVA